MAKTKPQEIDEKTAQILGDNNVPNVFGSNSIFTKSTKKNIPVEKDKPVGIIAFIKRLTS